MNGRTRTLPTQQLAGLVAYRGRQEIIIYVVIVVHQPRPICFRLFAGLHRGSYCTFFLAARYAAANGWSSGIETLNRVSFPSVVNFASLAAAAPAQHRDQVHRATRPSIRQAP